jgi:periplasmic protein TonB
MFDLISGGPRHPFHDPTPAPVMASIAGHAVALSLVVVLPLMYAADRLPKVPVMMAFVAAPPVPPPPPPPRTPARSAEKPATARPQSAPAPGAFAVPLEAPSAIVPEPPAAMYSGEGGVEGGIEGGVAGGIVGGLVAAPPPPPPPPVAPPALKPSEPVRIGGKIAAPGLVKRVEPIYPDLALMAKVGGMVILEAVVDADGSVESVRILRSVKFLDGAAMEAVKQWKYSPLILNGVPTPFVLTVTLNFHTV